MASPRGDLLISMDPPCSSTACRTIARPRPTPPVEPFPLRNGRNKSSDLPGKSPGPASSTLALRPGPDLGLPDNRQAEANSTRGAVSSAERTKQIFRSPRQKSGSSIFHAGTAARPRSRLAGQSPGRGQLHPWSRFLCGTDETNLPISQAKVRVQHLPRWHCGPAPISACRTIARPRPTPPVEPFPLRNGRNKSSDLPGKSPGPASSTLALRPGPDLGLPDNRQAEANSTRGAVSSAERTKQIFRSPRQKSGSSIFHAGTAARP